MDDRSDPSLTVGTRDKTCVVTGSHSTWVAGREGGQLAPEDFTGIVTALEDMLHRAR